MSAGAERDREAGPSRRDVLRGGSALGAGSLLAGCSPGGGAQAGSGPRAGRPHVYVEVFLAGGMDALSAVVPYGDADYYAARAELALAPPGEGDEVIDLDGFFGLAPAAAPLLTPYRNGHLALVHAAGSVDPSRSHFESRTKIELGTPGLPASKATDGWLARVLAGRPRIGTLRALSLEHILSISMRGADHALPLRRPSLVAFPGNPQTAGERSDALLGMYADEAAPIGSAARDSLDAFALLESVDFAGSEPANGAVYPDSLDGRRFRDAAVLIKAGIGLEVLSIRKIGWDHHANLGPRTGRMAKRLRELAVVLEAFYLDLLDLWADVTVVVQSEFGRRVAVNSSRGLDHGHGGLMMVMGEGVSGGRVHGSWPGLAPEQLDRGDLAVTTDYRDVVGEVLVERLGVGPAHLASIFPGHDYAPIGLCT